MIISIDEESCDKSECLFMIKILRKLEIEGSSLNLIKSIHKYEQNKTR